MKIENFKLKIVFFGASKYVIPTIQLLHANFDLCLVVTTERNPEDTVPAYCRANNIPYLSIKKFDFAVLEEVKKYSATLGVLAYFGVLLPKAVLEVFPKGILNIHPSLLPQYRGPTPVQSAILDGRTETGVTIIKLDDQMDHGPILGQVKEPIMQNDTTPDLHARLFKKGAEMLSQIIPDYINGKIKLVEQEDDKATFTKKDFTRQDGYFDIANPPAKDQLDRMIRAYFPWPGVWTKFKVLHSPSSGQESSKFKVVKFLPQQKLQMEGGKPMSVKDFLNGYPEMKEVLPDNYI